MATKIDEEAYVRELVERIKKAAARGNTGEVLLEKTAAKTASGSPLLAELEQIDRELDRTAADRAAVEEKVGAAFNVARGFKYILKEASVAALSTSAAYWATFFAALPKS